MAQNSLTWPQNGDDLLEAIEDLTKNPEQALSSLDQILELLNEPTKNCTNLASLSQGQPDMIGKIMAEMTLRKAIEKCLVTIAKMDNGIDEICKRASKLTDISLRSLYAIPTQNLQNWITKKLNEESVDSRKEASSFLKAVADEYTGRLASFKGTLKNVQKKKPERPPLFKELSPEVISDLCDKVKNEPLWLIRAQLASALGSLKSTDELVTCLKEALLDPEESVQRSAKTSLQCLRESS